MAAGHGFTGLVVILFFFLYITYDNEKKHQQEKVSTHHWFGSEFGTQRRQYRLCIQRSQFVITWSSSRHFDFVRLKVKGYFRSRVSRYSNSVATFQHTRLIISGDISLNPGPPAKQSCERCSRTIARNHRAVTCSLCNNKYHIKCASVKPKEFKIIQGNNTTIWNCPRCIQQSEGMSKAEISSWSHLPFTSLSDKSFQSEVGDGAPNSIYDESCTADESHLTVLAQKLQSCSSKDLRVAHLNIRSLRNKIDELRCLQLLCKFEILAITETHLDKSVPNNALEIEGMKFVRLDRIG